MKQKNPVGRPQKPEAERKLSCTISITAKRKKKLVAKYGSLTKAIESIDV